MRSGALPPITQIEDTELPMSTKLIIAGLLPVAALAPPRAQDGLLAAPNPSTLPAGTSPPPIRLPRPQCAA